MRLAICLTIAITLAILGSLGIAFIPGIPLEVQCLMSFVWGFLCGGVGMVVGLD